MRAVLLSIVFGFTFLSNLQALTLGQLRTEIRRNVRDTNSTSDDQRYSDSTLLDYINEAQREITNATWLTEKTTEYVLSPRTTYYNLPDDTLNILQVKFTPRTGASNMIDMAETSRPQLKTTFPNWEAVPGQPVYYFVDQSSFSANTSSTSLRISYIPIPTNLSTGTVKIWYYNQPRDLLNDTDIPFDARKHIAPYHSAIVFYVTMRLKTLEGRSDEAAMYMNFYMNALKSLLHGIGQMPNYTPGMVGGSGSK